MHLSMHSLNWIAVLVAGLSTMVVGFLWYSPLLFRRPWMREMGYDLEDKERIKEMQKSAGPAYAGSVVAGLISAITLALILHGLRGEARFSPSRACSSLPSTPVINWYATS